MTGGSGLWDDPDDVYEEWTEERFKRAAVYEDGKLVRPASGTWTKSGKAEEDGSR